MIRIGKNSIYYHHFTGGEKPRFVEEDELPMYLNDTVKLDKSVTFESLFKLIMIHKDLFNDIFNIGCLYGNKIDHYIDEFMKFDDEEKKSMDYLEVYWHSEYWDFKSGKELSFNPAFHGKSETGFPNIGLDFLPINTLRKYKVRINEHVQYNDWNRKGETNEERYPLLVEGNTEFRLFDLISGILHDISFYGTPEQRNEKLDELNETSKRIESGEEKTYEMKIEDDVINFYDTETGELHDTLGKIDDD